MHTLVLMHPSFLAYLLLRVRSFEDASNGLACELPTLRSDIRRPVPQSSVTKVVIRRGNRTYDQNPKDDSVLVLRYTASEVVFFSFSLLNSCTVASHTFQEQILLTETCPSTSGWLYASIIGICPKLSPSLRRPRSVLPGPSS